MPDANTRRSASPKAGLPGRSRLAKAGHPHKVLHLTTYDRLEAYLRAFAEGHFGLLILVGSGGLAKSRSVRAALGGQGVLDRGQRHAVRHVRQALPAPRRVRRHRRRRCPLRRPQRRAPAQMPVPDRGGKIRGLALRRAQPGEAGHPAGVRHQKPGRRSSPTTGRRSTRTWRRSRTAGMCCCSSPARRRSTARPGPGSTTRRSTQWFAANLHRVREPSMRHYVRARELKAAGMDWTEVLAAEAENKRERLAAELLASADPRQHRRAGQGVRRAGGRVPGDVLQLSAEVGEWGWIEGIASRPTY